MNQACDFLYDVYMFLKAKVYAYKLTRVSFWICMYVCVCVCMHVFVCVGVYIGVYRVYMCSRYIDRKTIGANTQEVKDT